MIERIIEGHRHQIDVALGAIVDGRNPCLLGHNLRVFSGMLGLLSTDELLRLCKGLEERHQKAATELVEVADFVLGSLWLDSQVLKGVRVIGPWRHGDKKFFTNLWTAQMTLEDASVQPPALRAIAERDELAKLLNPNLSMQQPAYYQFGPSDLSLEACVNLAETARSTYPKFLAATFTELPSPKFDIYREYVSGILGLNPPSSYGDTIEV